jgi:GMP synthase (glutamine-hydrolysing)
MDPQEFIDETIDYLRNDIQGRAVIACSGGVDSTVAAALVSQAIGERLLTIYVDNGLMRRDESENVREILTTLGVNFKVVQAEDEFLDALKGVVDPEKKRKVIGERFIRVFE